MKKFMRRKNIKEFVRTCLIVIFFYPLLASAYFGADLKDEEIAYYVIGKGNIDNISYDKDGYELYAVNKNKSSFVLIKKWEKGEDGVFGRYVFITNNGINAICTQYDLGNSKSFITCNQFDYENKKSLDDKSINYTDLKHKEN